MAKNTPEPKERLGWSDSLQLQEVEMSETPHEDPLVQQVAQMQEIHYRLKLEIRVKELEMGLYLAKARIAELELEKLKLK